MLTSIVVFVFLGSFVQPTFSCLSSGCCQSAAPACPAPCPTGYSCGSYGCARHRARSALTQKSARAVYGPEPDFTGSQNQTGSAPTRNIFGYVRSRNRVTNNVVKQTIDKDLPPGPPVYFSPNQQFRECCEEHDLPDPCLVKCNFNTYTKEALMAMYLKQDACPIEAASAMQHCAANAHDHRVCCAHSGVATTLAGDKCLVFCDQRPGIVTKLDFTYVACLDKFENMKRCFYNAAQQEISKNSGLQGL